MGNLDDPTDPTMDPTIEDPTDPTGVPDALGSGFRDEPTARAGTRTLKLPAPWLSTPDPAPRERPADPLFWPVVVFVAVLLAGIGIMLLRPSHHAPSTSSFESR